MSLSYGGRKASFQTHSLNSNHEVKVTNDFLPGHTICCCHFRDRIHDPHKENRKDTCVPCHVERQLLQNVRCEQN